MQPVPPQWVPPSTSATERRRGFLLGSFLVLGMLGNMIGAAMAILGAGAAAGAEKAAGALDPAAASAARSSHNAMLFMALLAVCSLGCLTGAWMWKKWGVYGYAAISCLGFIVGWRASPVSALVNIAGTVVVAASVALKWRDFE
jgi:hypothetical protein